MLGHFRRSGQVDDMDSAKITKRVNSLGNKFVRNSDIHKLHLLGASHSELTISMAGHLGTGKTGVRKKYKETQHCTYAKYIPDHPEIGMNY
jgi:hypothetical protein